MADLYYVKGPITSGTVLNPPNSSLTTAGPYLNNNTSTFSITCTFKVEGTGPWSVVKNEPSASTFYTLSVNTSGHVVYQAKYSTGTLLNLEFTGVTLSKSQWYTVVLSYSTFDSNNYVLCTVNGTQAGRIKGWKRGLSEVNNNRNIIWGDSQVYFRGQFSIRGCRYNISTDYQFSSSVDNFNKSTGQLSSPDAIQSAPTYIFIVPTSNIYSFRTAPVISVSPNPISVGYSSRLSWTNIGTDYLSIYYNRGSGYSRYNTYAASTISTPFTTPESFYSSSEDYSLSIKSTITNSSASESLSSDSAVTYVSVRTYPRNFNTSGLNVSFTINDKSLRSDGTSQIGTNYQVKVSWNQFPLVTSQSGNFNYYKVYECKIEDDSTISETLISEGDINSPALNKSSDSYYILWNRNLSEIDTHKYYLKLSCHYKSSAGAVSTNSYSFTSYQYSPNLSTPSLSLNPGTSIAVNRQVKISWTPSDYTIKFKTKDNNTSYQSQGEYDTSPATISILPDSINPAEDYTLYVKGQLRKYDQYSTDSEAKTLSVLTYPRSMETAGFIVTFKANSQEVTDTLEVPISTTVRIDWSAYLTEVYGNFNYYKTYLYQVDQSTGSIVKLISSSSNTNNPQNAGYVQRSVVLDPNKYYQLVLQCYYRSTYDNTTLSTEYSEFKSPVFKSIDVLDAPEFITDYSLPTINNRPTVIMKLPDPAYGDVKDFVVTIGTTTWRYSSLSSNFKMTYKYENKLNGATVSFKIPSMTLTSSISTYAESTLSGRGNSSSLQITYDTLWSSYLISKNETITYSKSIKVYQYIYNTLSRWKSYYNLDFPSSSSIVKGGVVRLDAWFNYLDSLQVLYAQVKVIRKDSYSLLEEGSDITWMLEQSQSGETIIESGTILQGEVETVGAYHNTILKLLSEYF